MKGLYAKAAAGQLRGMTGVDDPYEVPVDPDLTIQTEQISVADAVRVIVDRFGIGEPALVSTVQETA